MTFAVCDVRTGCPVHRRAELVGSVVHAEAVETDAEFIHESRTDHSDVAGHGVLRGLKRGAGEGAFITQVDGLRDAGNVVPADNVLGTCVSVF